MAHTHTSHPSASRRWVWATQAVAAGVGLVLGYDFGVRISGTLLGVVLALNGALFCSMVVDVLADRLVRARAAH
jgi:hypothetical protein